MDDFRIERFVPEDAEDITACYREIYGDDFPIRYVYDPEQIIERFDGENHLALVARTADSEFAGIGSLFRIGRNPRLYEIGQFMVRRPFRKHGLSTIFTERIINEFSRQVSAQAVFGQCLCNHFYSQRLSLGHGFVPTGLELEWLPAKSFDSTSLQRNISLLPCCIMLENSRETIHAPREYREFIQERCARLGLERVFVDRPAPGQGRTDFIQEIAPDSATAVLSVISAGEDYPSVLDAFEKASKGRAVHAIIDLGTPSAAWAVSLLRDHGYFLAGFLPVWCGSDAIALQKLPAEPEFEALVLVSEESRRIAAIVREDWDRTRL